MAPVTKKAWFWIVLVLVLAGVGALVAYLLGAFDKDDEEAEAPTEVVVPGLAGSPAVGGTQGQDIRIDDYVYVRHVGAAQGADTSGGSNYLYEAADGFVYANGTQAQATKMTLDIVYKIQYRLGGDGLTLDTNDPVNPPGRWQYLRMSNAATAASWAATVDGVRSTLGAAPVIDGLSVYSAPEAAAGVPLQAELPFKYSGSAQGTGTQFAMFNAGGKAVELGGKNGFQVDAVTHRVIGLDQGSSDYFYFEYAGQKTDVSGDIQGGDRIVIEHVDAAGGASRYVKIDRTANTVGLVDMESEATAFDVTAAFLPPDYAILLRDAFNFGFYLSTAEEPRKALKLNSAEFATPADVEVVDFASGTSSLLWTDPTDVRQARLVGGYVFDFATGGFKTAKNFLSTTSSGPTLQSNYLIDSQFNAAETWRFRRTGTAPTPTPLPVPGAVGVLDTVVIRHAAGAAPAATDPYVAVHDDTYSLTLTRSLAQAFRLVEFRNGGASAGNETNASMRTVQLLQAAGAPGEYKTFALGTTENSAPKADDLDVSNSAVTLPTQEWFLSNATSVESGVTLFQITAPGAIPDQTARRLYAPGDLTLQTRSLVQSSFYVERVTAFAAKTLTAPAVVDRANLNALNVQATQTFFSDPVNAGGDPAFWSVVLAPASQAGADAMKIGLGSEVEVTSWGQDDNQDNSLTCFYGNSLDLSSNKHVYAIRPTRATMRMLLPITAGVAGDATAQDTAVAVPTQGQAAALTSLRFKSWSMPAADYTSAAEAEKTFADRDDARNDVFTHGFGRVPDLWRVLLVCKAADAGYAAGEQIDVTSWGRAEASDKSTIVCFATKFTIEVRSYDGFFPMGKASDSTETPPLVPSRWRYQVEAWSRLDGATQPIAVSPRIARTGGDRLDIKTFGHNLGKRPDLFRVYMTLKDGAATGDYAQGQYFDVTSIGMKVSRAWTTCWADETNVSVASNQLTFLDRNRNFELMPGSRVDFVVKAWA